MNDPKGFQLPVSITRRTYSHGFRNADVTDDAFWPAVEKKAASLANMGATSKPKSPNMSTRKWAENTSSPPELDGNVGHQTSHSLPQQQAFTHRESRSFGTRTFSNDPLSQAVPAALNKMAPGSSRMVAKARSLMSKTKLGEFLHGDNICNLIAAKRRYPEEFRQNFIVESRKRRARGLALREGYKEMNKLLKSQPTANRLDLINKEAAKNNSFDRAKVSKLGIDSLVEIPQKVEMRQKSKEASLLDPKTTPIPESLEKQFASNYESRRVRKLRQEVVDQGTELFLKPIQPMVDLTYRSDRRGFVSLADKTIEIRDDELSRQRKKTKQNLLNTLLEQRKFINQAQTMKQVKYLKDGWLGFQKLDFDPQKITTDKLKEVQKQQTDYLMSPA